MEQDVPALAQQFIDALHRLERGQETDVDGLVALFGADAELINPILKLDDRQHAGQESIRQFWIAYRRAVGQASSEFYQVTTNDQAAGLFWTTKGTATDGQAMAYDGVSLLVFDDAGKIVRFRAYYDTREFNRAVGIEGA
jgi:ketosteroid isomerase-like protein